MKLLQALRNLAIYFNQICFRYVLLYHLLLAFFRRLTLDLRFGNDFMLLLNFYLWRRNCVGLINLCMAQLIPLVFLSVLGYREHFSVCLAVKFVAENPGRPALILLNFEKASELFFQLTGMTIFEQSGHDFLLDKDNFSFRILLQKSLCDGPHECTGPRGSDDVSNIHPGSEGRLEEGDRIFHGTHHGHDAFIADVNDSVPHFDMSWNEEISDDELEEVDFALIDFLFGEVQIYHLFDIQHQDRTELGVPACQVVHPCFLNSKTITMYFSMLGPRWISLC